MIDDDTALARACERLAAADSLALDTEFMREKTYAPGLCLVQLRGTAGEPMLIDPLALEDISPLARLFASDGCETILHSCRQDLEALDTRMAMEVHALFDTQVAAAFCGLGDQVSYGALVAEITGVTLDKAHTRADWSRRPLPDAELDYAADDVRYLHAVRDHLGEQLEASGRMAWFREECARQAAPETWRPDPEQAWQRLRGAASLPVAAQETARRLARWREARAVQRDRPREWILPTPVLLEVSRKAPADTAALAAIEGMNGGILRNAGRDILDVVREAPRDPHGEVLWQQQELMPPEERKRVKSIMHLLRDVAGDLGISPSLLANRAAVERFVRDAAEIDLFRGWRLAVAGERVLKDYS